MSDQIIIGIDGVAHVASDEQAAEIAAVQAQMAVDKAAAEQAAIDALEARKAPLRRLGLNEDEINTVLGL